MCADAGFLPQYTSWEAFNFAWKFVMCAGVPLIFPKSVTQIVIAMIITVLHVLALGTFEPCKVFIVFMLHCSTGLTISCVYHCLTTRLVAFAYSDANRTNTNMSLLVHTSMVFKLGFMVVLRTHSAGPDLSHHGNVSAVIALGPVACVLAISSVIGFSQLIVRIYNFVSDCCTKTKVAETEYYAGTDSDEEMEVWESTFGD
jgi:hypothetical protein